MKIQVQNNIIQKHLRIPPLGERIIKTGVAVSVCLIIYLMRGYQGMVSQSCVAAIICMQPYKQDGAREAVNRILGTVLGAAWGLLFLEFMKQFPVIQSAMFLVYLLMGVGTILSIYTAVLLKQADSAALTAIVYICIVCGYPNIEEPFMQTVHQLVDTFIGILVAAGVNSFTLPRVKHPEYVFFVRLQDLVPDRYAQVSSKVLVMLNRLYNEGAQISLVSRWAPAFLLSQMGTMNINLPVIVMDGAALYDIPNKQYQMVKAIPRETVEELEKILLERNLGYCIYAVQESNMFVYRRGNQNKREDEDYQLMKRSPYRNYVSGELASEDQVAFVRLVGEDAEIAELEKELQDVIPKNQLRIDRRKQPKVNGCSGLYFYDIDATIKNRKLDLLEMQQQLNKQGLVPVDIISDKAYVSEGQALHLLNKLRNVYSPVSFKG